MGLVALGSGWQARVQHVVGAVAGLSLTNEASERLCRMLDLLVTWNQRIDLTAARTSDELVDLMLADSAALLGPARSLSLSEWVDVGAGAGAPGLPLALLAPELAVTLVEPQTKRVAFLRSVLGSLGRSDVRVLRSRSEALPAAGWDAAISRATLPPAQWLAEGGRLARRAVAALLARAEAPESLDLIQLEPIEYDWPLTAAPRKLVLYVRPPGPAGDGALR
jgi:16S rRNA (guanine527-N7)-methyltransferase